MRKLGRPRFLMVLGAVLLSLLVITSLVFVVWACNPYPASASALDALHSDETVKFSVSSWGWLVFEPVGKPEASGLVWYPAARVDARSYAPLARQIARSGHTVVIVPMPLNFPFFDPDAGRQVVRYFPNVGSWAIGGHSLGGTMAAELVKDSATFSGLLFCAAYPGPTIDMTGRTGLLVYSIFGSNDTFATLDKVLASKKQLPPTAHFVAIPGANYAGFGSFGVLPGDGPTTLSPEQQQTIVAGSIEEMLDLIGH